MRLTVARRGELIVDRTFQEYGEARAAQAVAIQRHPDCTVRLTTASGVTVDWVGPRA
jgi:hypothetical protein